jgi:hypothetical protein
MNIRIDKFPVVLFAFIGFGCEKTSPAIDSSNKNKLESFTISRTFSDSTQVIETTENLHNGANSGLSVSLPESQSIADYISKHTGLNGGTRAEVASELYAELTKGQDRSAQLKVFSAFYPILFEDFDNLAKVFSELPAGDLRRMALGCLGSLKSTEMERIYRTMAESNDRQKIANGFVSKSYFEFGLGRAIDNVRTLDLPSEKVAATVHLSDQMLGANTLKNLRISSSDIQMLKAFAEGLGMDEISSVLLASNHSHPTALA